MESANRAVFRQSDVLDPNGVNGLEWVGRHRRAVIAGSAALLLVIVLAIVAGVVWVGRSHAAADAFGLAMDAYQAPVLQAGQPALPGVKSYATNAERAKAANDLFRQVADAYPFTADGRNARYLQALTDVDKGQTQAAETNLKQVADSWDKPLAALAKLSLAGLYRQTGRDAQAIELYNQLTDHPTDTVPAGLAQLQLADLYNTQGRTELARKIYAQLKDSDKNAKGKPGVTSTIAGEKLNPTATPQAQPQL